ncbi:MAG: extracellular solute-binding protein [Actinomycetota bacterium]|nr:extracellular solute-binding protein [Actinomycetota bacterium]
MCRGETCHRSVVAFLLAAATAALVACGGNGEGGARELTWFIQNQPGGALEEIAANCAEQSNGRYSISFELLPSDASQAREQLVRRLGAEDDTIDLIGMDIIWTGEFANAGWILPVPQEIRPAVTENVFDSVLETASFEGEMVNVPIWSNTQLLWYREDRVPEPPQTWDEMIAMAEELGPQGTIQLQANRYEGLMVWANYMIESAGTSILSAPEEIELEQGPTERALSVMGEMSRSPAAATDFSTSDEESAATGFETGDSTFMINYPFVYASAEENAPDVFENLAAAELPRVDPRIESAPPIGGINLAVSAFSQSSDLAFEAVECLVSEENQLTVVDLEKLPPVRSDLYDEPELEEAYPGFADQIRESIENAAPRPSGSAAYQDISLAVQRAIHPTADIDPADPTPTYERLLDRLEQAIERRGLL